MQLDIVKGLAIFLVLWGHSIQFLLTDASYYSNPVFKLIYSFHMPLFALVSGYFYYHTVVKYRLGDLLLSRVRSFLIPIVCWTTIAWLVTGILQRSLSVGSWWHQLTGTGLWFLWSILATTVTLAVVEKVFARIPFGAVIGVALGCLAMYLFPNPQQNLFLYPYVVIGYYYKKHQGSFGCYTRYAWLAIPAFILLYPGYNADPQNYTPGRYLIGLVGSVCVILLVYQLYGKWTAVDQHLSTLGRYTMQIYILQGYFYHTLGRVWPHVYPRLGIGWGVTDYWLLDLVAAPLLSVVLAVVLVVLSQWVQQHCPLIHKWCFGARK